MSYYNNFVIAFLTVVSHVHHRHGNVSGVSNPVSVRQVCLSVTLLRMLGSSTGMYRTKYYYIVNNFFLYYNGYMLNNERNSP